MPPIAKIQAQIVQHLVPGGIEIMALDLMRCAGADREVHVIAIEGDAVSALETWPKLRNVKDRLHFLDKGPGFRLGTIWQLAQLLRKLKVQAVQTHHIGPLLYGGLASLLAGVRRLVHTEHDAWHLQHPERRKLQNFLIGLLRPVLVADSKLVQAELARTLPNRHYQVIRNGVDCEIFIPGDKTAARARYDLPLSETVIGCSSRMEAVKGHGRLLQAHALLPSSFHLALAGQGSLEPELRSMVRDLGTEGRVFFLGYVDDMPAFYQALDLFCLPSNNEGMPLSPLEAQACGIACVATDVGGVREAVCPKHGIIVPATAPSVFAAAIIEALQLSAVDEIRKFVTSTADLQQVVAAYQVLMLIEENA